MGLWLLEAVGLCLFAPCVAALLPGRKAPLAVGLPVIAFLGVLVVVYVKEAVLIDRMLERRVRYALVADGAGKLSATLLPIEGAEGIHVSLVDAPPEVTQEKLRKLTWWLEGFEDRALTRWFDETRPGQPGDGIALLELGDRPLKSSVTLRVDAATEVHPWLVQARLQVRPCGFTLKMYPIVVGLLRLRAGICVFGIALTATILFVKLRRRRRSLPQRE